MKHSFFSRAVRCVTRVSAGCAAAALLVTQACIPAAAASRGNVAAAIFPAVTVASQSRVLATNSMPLVYVSKMAGGQVLAYSAASLQAPVETISGLKNPRGVAVDAVGNLYVVEVGLDVKVFAPGSLTPFRTLAGTATLAASNILYSLVVDGRGTVYVATLQGIWVYRNGAVAPSYILNDPSIAAPHQLAVDKAGNVFVSYQATDSSIRVGLFPASISPATSTLVPLSNIDANRYPYALAIDANGDLIVGDCNNDANLNLDVGIYAPLRQTPALTFPIWNLNGNGTYVLALTADNHHIFIATVKLNPFNKLVGVLYRYAYPSGTLESSVPLPGHDAFTGIATYPSPPAGTW